MRTFVRSLNKHCLSTHTPWARGWDRNRPCFPEAAVGSRGHKMFPGLHLPWLLPLSSSQGADLTTYSSPQGHLPLSLSAQPRHIGVFHMKSYLDAKGNPKRTRTKETTKAEKKTWITYLAGTRVLHFSFTERIFPQTPVFHTPSPILLANSFPACRALRRLSKGGIGCFLGPNRLLQIGFRTFKLSLGVIDLGINSPPALGSLLTFAGVQGKGTKGGPHAIGLQIQI